MPGSTGGSGELSEEAAAVTRRKEVVTGPPGGDEWSAYGFASRLDVGSERKRRSLVLNPSNLKTGLLLNEMGKVPTDGAHSWEGVGEVRRFLQNMLALRCLSDQTAVDMVRPFGVRERGPGCR